MGLHGIVLGFLGDLRNDKGFFSPGRKMESLPKNTSANKNWLV